MVDGAWGCGAASVAPGAPWPLLAMDEAGGEGGVGSGAADCEPLLLAVAELGGLVTLPLGVLPLAEPLDAVEPDAGGTLAAVEDGEEGAG